MLRMKTILYRYLFREIAATFLFSLVVFTLVLFMGKVLQLAELVFINGVSLKNILRLFLYLLPSFSLVTIPMSFLLAVLLTFARLSTDNEITALKSCGVSLYGLLPPVLGAACVAYALTAYITAYALPWGQTSFRKLMFDFLDTTQTLQLKEAVFNDQFPGLIIYTEHFNPRDSSMAGIIIHDSREGQEQSTIFARQGVIRRDPEQRSVRLHLADGSIHHLMPQLGYRLISFASYDIVINFAKPVVPIVFDERFMNFGELRRSLNLPPLPEDPAGRAQRVLPADRPSLRLFRVRPAGGRPRHPESADRAFRRLCVQHRDTSRLLRPALAGYHPQFPTGHAGLAGHVAPQPALHGPRDLALPEGGARTAVHAAGTGRPAAA